MPEIPISYTGLGILFSVCGNLLISISLNIQKQAHKKHPNKHLDTNSRVQFDASSKGPSYIYSIEWWSGFLLMTLGEVGNFVAYGLAPVSIVSPMGVVTIISNSTFIAPVLFHEKIRKRDIIGTFIASSGVVMMIFSSIKEDDGNNNDDGYISDPYGYLDSVVMSWNFTIYLTLTSLIVVFLILHLSKFKRHRSIRYVLYNLCVVALFGSYTAMATKLLSTIIGFSSLSNIMENYRPYVLLIVIVGTSILQIKYLNKCLKVSDSTTVVPIHFVFFTTSVLIGSAVIFKDFADKSSSSVALFICGALLTFFGVFFICGGTKEEERNGNQYSVSVMPVNESHHTENVVAASTEVSSEDTVPHITIHDDEDHDILNSSQQSKASSLNYGNENDEDSPLSFKYQNSKKFSKLTTQDNVLHVLQTSKSTPELQVNQDQGRQFGKTSLDKQVNDHRTDESNTFTIKDTLPHSCNTYKNYSSTDIPSEISSTHHNSGKNIQLHVPQSGLKPAATERRKSIADIYQAGLDFLPLKDRILSPVNNRSKASLMGNGYFAIAGTGNVLMTAIFNTDDSSSIETTEMHQHSQSTSFDTSGPHSIQDDGDLV